MTDSSSEDQDVNDLFKRASEAAKEKKQAAQHEPGKEQQNTENYDPLAGNSFDYFKPEE